MGIVQKEQRLGDSSYLDDMVVIRQPEKPGEPSIITINCPDKTGLGCDLCRIILFFGLSIVRGGILLVALVCLSSLRDFPKNTILLRGPSYSPSSSAPLCFSDVFLDFRLRVLSFFLARFVDMSTDGRWCYIVFWVVGRGATRWELLKKRLLGACPSAALGIYSYCFGKAEQEPKQPQVFLLKFWCNDRLGLLHDVTQVLCDLELTIRRVKVSTTPDGKVVDLFFITDTRELLHTKNRKDETKEQLKAALGETMIDCEIELPSTEVTLSLQPSSSLPSTISEEAFMLELPEESPKGSSLTPDVRSVTMDNSLSPSHTLIQIVCRDHKGLLYDIMRTLKDYNIQISYGRFYANQYECCELDLFVMQADGKKIVDPNKQKALCSRLRMELFCPLRVTVQNRGPETELLVANPVELSGKGRPLVFYDITLALKMLNTCIFLAEIGRHVIGDREWEVYRVLLDDSYRNTATKNKIEEGVLKMLMGWE
ncbi:hypothetical protein Taro_022930 [Colocasia esculenta]|uniref:ACT domain-containing protein ACR n=1 Tax=Colocasia esculenta TaxID=4460 RepID=A0A843VFV0_COLES|nr:hypothetical protein [Colocasia esculenta]